MTEIEWLDCTDPTPMLEFLRGKAGDRKLRLLVVAACRRIWGLLPVSCQTFTNVSERYADGSAATSEYQEAWQQVEADYHATDLGAPGTLTYAIASVGVSDPPTSPSASSCLGLAATAVARTTADVDPDDIFDTGFEDERLKEGYEQVRLLRDILGTPFRPSILNPVWLTPTVTDLAQSAYEERVLPSGELDIDRLAVLSDAVEEAGCDDADILNHLRSPGPHVRGCWAIDLLLGKG